jgi:hypothetical protein
VVVALWALIAAPLMTGQCFVVRMQHRPCPGCGTMRALGLFFHGDLRASFAIHPLAVPAALVYAAFAVTSISGAARVGVPWAAFESLWGRRALYAVVAVMTLEFALWLARGCGAFGGPVPV